MPCLTAHIWKTHNIKLVSLFEINAKQQESKQCGLSKSTLISLCVTMSSFSTRRRLRHSSPFSPIFLMTASCLARKPLSVPACQLSAFDFLFVFGHHAVSDTIPVTLLCYLFFFGYCIFLFPLFFLLINTGCV